MRKYLLSFLLILISFSFVHAQDIVVKGQLLGEEPNEILPFATI
jgi:hypothetical protein